MKISLLVLLVSLVALPLPIVAQAINEDGVKLYGSYHGSEIDNVSLTSGHVDLRIPLLEYPQRGGKLNLSFSIRYRTATWNQTKSCDTRPCILYWEPADEQPSDVWISVDQSKYSNGSGTIAFPDGSRHPLGNINGDGINPPWETIDATGMRLEQTATIFPDGSRLITTSNSQIAEDVHGNQITFGASTITDTMGRVIPQPIIGAGGLPSTTDFHDCTGLIPTTNAWLWQVPGANGSSVPLKFCYAPVCVFTHHFSTDDATHVEFNQCVLDLQSIVLPDGHAWTFDYTQPDANGVNWGELAKITLPTGGTISYTWDHVTGCQAPYYHAASTGPRVLTRTVDANDGTGPHQWSYSISTASATVTDPFGNDTVHTLANLNNACALFESSVAYFSGSSVSGGTLLKTVNTDYSWTTIPNPGSLAPQPPINVVPIRKTTVWANGTATKVEYDYDTGFNFTAVTNSGNVVVQGIYGKQTAERVYDFGNPSPGSLLRTTSTAYLWQSNAPYVTYNILDTPTTIGVYDGIGALRAQSINSYDETALGSSGVTVSRDSFPPNTVYRGNVTTRQHWLNGSTVSTANCPVAVNNGYTAETKAFLDTGMVSQSTDACLHSTTFQYAPAASSGAGAYLTQSCNPLNQCTSMGYDFNTGLPTSVTDPNNQTTSRVYDNLGRLKTISYPDTGETDFYYPDAVTVEKKVVIDRPTNLWADGFFYFDGLGRRKQTRLVDQEGDVYTETSYDVLGRVSNVTNPHRSIAAATDGSTTTQYDALGRPTILTHNPDGNTLQTAYADPNVVTTTDETGRQRRTTTDALGRLVQVDEPGDTSSLAQPYSTLYSYDLLGNLTRVEQHGNASDSAQWRVRTFSYDSLSRLTQSNNPESGQISYSYDADGNVVSKTSPAPGQPSLPAATVITNFTYDKLHRLTFKSYTGNGYTETTPSVTYSFDQGCCGVNPLNGIGRMTYAVSGNTELVYVYDPMGRITSQFDCPPSGIARGSCYPISAIYNQIGAITTLNYPSGRQVLTAYNAAGRLLNVKLAIPGGGQYSYYAAAQGTPTDPSTWGYWPSGAMRLGNFGNSVRELTGYNNRLQISSISESLGVTTLFSKSYNLYDAAGHNNGNVMGITDLLNSAKNQTYTYDALNRIATGSQADNAFNIAFTIDPWGNMKESGTSDFMPFFDTKNRMQGWSYDSAGNLLNDVSHSYTYDAENRIFKVDSGVDTYTYNPLGNRVRKDTASGSTEYFVFGGNTIAELNPATGVWTDYIFGGSKRYAKDTSTNAGAVQYYHGDHLGTTRIMTDASGTKISDCIYAPFGEEVACSPSNASNHYKFTGKERDIESGLDYFGARYYSNGLGRFVTPDWAAKPAAVPYADFGDPQSLNLYGYAGGNPVTKADIDGHCYPLCGTDLGALSQSVQKQADKLKQSVHNFVHQHPRTMQALKGTGQILAGGAGIVVAAHAEVGSGGLATAAVVVGVQASAVLIAQGSANIVGALTKSDVSESEKGLSATRNIAGQVTTAATGNLEKGETAATALDVGLLVSNPKDLLEGSKTDQAIKAGQSLSTVQDAVNAVRPANDKKEKEDDKSKCCTR